MICEKCGFDYMGEKCPVCAIEAEEMKEKSKKAVITADNDPTEEKTGLGLAGMIVSIIGVFLPTLTLSPIMILSTFLGPLVPIVCYSVGTLPNVIGLILSIAGKKKDRTGYASITGAILSAVGVALRVIAVATIAIIMALSVVAVFIIYVLAFISMYYMPVM